MFRSFRLSALLVAAVLCLVGLTFGAPRPPDPGDLLAGLKGALTRGERLAETYRPGELPRLTTERSILDDLLARVPDRPPPDVAAAAVRAQGLANLLDVLRAGSALRGDAAVVTDLALVPQAAAPATTRALRDDMAAAAENIIKDVACGEAWNLLSDRQKLRIGAPVESHDHLGATVEAIEGEARSVLSRNWQVTFLDRAVSWVAYGSGALEKAEAFVGFLKGGYLTPLDTRAFSYYAQYCMRPPG
ncbi:hypothetical protein [Streptomyces venezuelae]|uniref:hypothetical protein n=1 Tax=Streptomyces venezuelae TaxID=54571 RepID=UPI00278C1760|nr:hypothetical protein [Streptomyces venezuelae]